MTHYVVYFLYTSFINNVLSVHQIKQLSYVISELKTPFCLSVSPYVMLHVYANLKNGQQDELNCPEYFSLGFLQRDFNGTEVELHNNIIHTSLLMKVHNVNSIEGYLKQAGCTHHTLVVQFTNHNQDRLHCVKGGSKLLLQSYTVCKQTGAKAEGEE